MNGGVKVRGSCWNSLLTVKLFPRKKVTKRHDNDYKDKHRLQMMVTQNIQTGSGLKMNTDTKLKRQNIGINEEYATLTSHYK